MMQKAEQITKSTLPTRLDALTFRAKSSLLQAKRWVVDLSNNEIKPARKNDDLKDAPIVAESVSDLWTEIEPEERFLVAGKIQNLRVAIEAINGSVIDAGNIFSFWKTVNRTTKRRGFVKGRELREGCIIPSIGGGLCQISNALYDAALKANFEIVERHAHSQTIAGSLAEIGRDATVFWNYIDLRFRSEAKFRIEAFLSADKLTVRFRAINTETLIEQKVRRRTLYADQPRSCASCGLDDCHRVVINPEAADFGKTAYLVDDLWPEFNSYISKDHAHKDTLFLPIDGQRFRKANYAWSTANFSKVHQSILPTLIRSYRSRRLATQGSARQLNLLATYESLANNYAKRIDHECLHIVIQQNLLPYLWKNGVLGGRTFDVLMTALPMHHLQRSLDVASKLHPESKTLGDFRADQRLVDLENEALTNARKIITPHTAIADLFKEKAELIDWQMPDVTSKTIVSNTDQTAKPRVVFASSTVGRKGCYELREALRGVDVKIVLAGPLIEGKDFWEGFDVEPAGSDPLSSADLVVLPAFVEHRPRRLLRAAALGIPVIATDECGINNVEGITTIKSGDHEMLRSAILEQIGS